MLGFDAFLLILILNITAVVRYEVSKSENFKQDVVFLRDLLKRIECFIQGKRG